MGIILNNNNNFNPSEINTFSTISEHTKKLNEKIINLKSLNVTSNYLESKTDETNKIINTKNLTSVSKSEVNSVETSLCNKNLTLVDLLLVKNNIRNLQASFPRLNSIKILNNKSRYFGIGNRNMTLDIFLNMLNVLTKNIKQIQENTKQYNTNNLRHYLNLLTNFESKLCNSNYNLYKFNKTNKYLFAMQKASKFLNTYFNSNGCYISKPLFNLIYTNNKIENKIGSSLNKNFKLNEAKIIINLFYFTKTIERNSDTLTKQENKSNILSDLHQTKFSYLTDYLTKLFDTEVELNLVRLYLPYQDSNILVQNLNSESYNNKFIRLVSQLFKNININNNNSNLTFIDKNNQFSYPSKISGVNIKLAGRPLNERIIPRLTVKRAQRGSFNKLNARLIEKSMFTDRTKKGAFSFTVTLSQNFNK